MTVLTRDAAGFPSAAPHLAAHAAVTLQTGDVRDFAFPAGRFSHVIHAATDARARGGDDGQRHLFDTIVSGTRRALECARHTGASRFLLTSSGAIYGRQPAALTHVSEDDLHGFDPTVPASAYAEGKRAAEMLCALHADAELQPTIARCFAFVGPHLPVDAHFAVGNFIRDALDGGPIRVAGDGTPYRSYLYASDLAVWLWTVLLRGQPMRPYNVGSESAITIRDLATAVAGQCSPPAQVCIARPAPAHASAERYVPNTTRARTELGVSPTVGLDEAIRRTLAWHRRRNHSFNVVN